MSILEKIDRVLQSKDDGEYDKNKSKAIVLATKLAQGGGDVDDISHTLLYYISVGESWQTACDKVVRKYGLATAEVNNEKSGADDKPSLLNKVSAILNDVSVNVVKFEGKKEFTNQLLDWKLFGKQLQAMRSKKSLLSENTKDERKNKNRTLLRTIVTTKATAGAIIRAKAGYSGNELDIETLKLKGRKLTAKIEVL